ncbi:MAG: cupredoxin family copper-binding protein [bacterium]|nr:cupredoxin family copper-binding protein [bacterium]
MLKSNGVKKIIWLGIFFIAILALSGCSLYENNQTVAPRPAQTARQPEVSTNNAITVNIENFSFNSNSVTIKKGTTVTWINNDSAPHEIKSTGFNSEILSKDQSFSFTFNEAGTFGYSCSIHPSMTGEIIVE